MDDTTRSLHHFNSINPKLTLSTHPHMLPTVPDPVPVHSYTLLSDIPAEFTALTPSTETAHIVLGVDEAGRGPLIGPMVYSVGYCSTTYSVSTLPNCAFADSKKLTEDQRDALMASICTTSADNDNDDDDDTTTSTSNNNFGAHIGYAVQALSPLDIATQMQRPSTLVVNLNEQAHSSTIGLINAILAKFASHGIKVVVDGLYIDTVGPPATYQRKLRTMWPESTIREIRVEKKADDTYPIVSAASIVAKTTRDEAVRQPQIKWGSGYPSDPNTKAWVAANIHRWFGWNALAGTQIRYSWGTAKNALVASNAVDMRWEHELVRKHGYNGEDVLNNINMANRTEADSPQTWFGVM